MKIAFATCAHYPELTPDDRLLLPVFAGAGVEIIPLIWDAPDFFEALEAQKPKIEALVIRSTWDYYLSLPEFQAWILEVKKRNVPIYNSPEILLWNSTKSYLRELEENGVAIVPTHWVGVGEELDLEEKLRELGWSDAVIKPLTSADGHGTVRVDRTKAAVMQKFAAHTAQTKGLMIQPFLSEIMSEGEISLLYYGGEFSHAVIKKPGSGDFRVQEKYGGSFHAFQAFEAMVTHGKAVLGKLPFKNTPLYARVDLISSGGKLLLGELEMLEPALYFKFDEEAPRRFLQSFLKIHSHPPLTK